MYALGNQKLHVTHFIAIFALWYGQGLNPQYFHGMPVLLGKVEGIEREEEQKEVIILIFRAIFL